MAFAAMLCGAETCVDMADFAADKLDVLGPLLGPLLGLLHGAPSHDTVSRVFRRLDPAAFEAAFCRFMQSFAAACGSQGAGQGEAGRVLAVDGKSLRGAVDTARPSTPLHLVTVWAAEQRLVLGGARAPNRSEVTAARDILALFDLRGTTVTADALHGPPAHGGCHPRPGR